MNAEVLRVMVLDQGNGVWGAQRYLLRLAPLLLDHGVELTLAGPRTLELHNVWRDAGFPAIHLDLPTDRSIRVAGRPSLSGLAREGGNIPRVARLISDAARAGDFDALWANSHWTHLDSSIASRACGKPVVLHLHEEAMPGLGVWLRATAVRLATRTVAVSYGVAQGLPRFAESRVSVIPNGVDTQIMSPLTRISSRTQEIRAEFGIASDDLMVLAATRLDPSKRIEDLMATVRAVEDPRIRLVIAGSTSEYPDYERDVLAQAHSMPTGQVVFCGTRDDMAEIFRACDVVIHAGTVEGMPLGLIEAQACAKPVVAYAVAGVPEAVRDGSTGLLAAPLDVAGLASSLKRLVGDPALRARLGAAGRANVLAHHWIGRQAQLNAAVLTEMCRSSQEVAA